MPCKVFSILGSAFEMSQIIMEPSALLVACVLGDEQERNSKEPRAYEHVA